MDFVVLCILHHRDNGVLEIVVIVFVVCIDMNVVDKVTFSIVVCRLGQRETTTVDVVVSASDRGLTTRHIEPWTLSSTA